MVKIQLIRPGVCLLNIALNRNNYLLPAFFLPAIVLEEVFLDAVFFAAAFPGAVSFGRDLTGVVSFVVVFFDTDFTCTAFFAAVPA